MASKTRVVRTILLNPGMMEPASKALAAIDGVESVTQAGPERLRVAYDVTRAGWGVLCDRLNEVKAFAPGGRFAHWHDRWRNFREQRMRNNQRSRPSCCG